MLSEQKKNSDNYNLALQDQVSKYAILFNDEKTERKELLQKYDTLQEKHHSSAIEYEKEK